MIFTHEAPIPLPIGAIGLDEWLFNLSEADYKACARGHRAVGTNGGPRFAGMVNVESMAGALLIQHYRTELLQPGHVRLFSAASRGYLMHLVPFHLKVGWEMQVFSFFAGRVAASLHNRRPESILGTLYRPFQCKQLLDTSASH